MTAGTVRVVTDSACDLPAEVCASLGIEVVPLTIRFGDEELVDRQELSPDEFWTRMATTDVLPETAAPSVGAFEEAFQRLADDGAQGILCINLSSRLSATMQSAQVAAKALEGGPEVEIVDSMSATMGIGLLVEHAARRAADGADLAELTADVESRRDRTNLYGAVDTLEFLKRGGRIGGAQALLGSMLSIKPIITCRDGVVEPAGKVRTRSKALSFLVDRIKETQVDQIAIMHANAGDVNELVERIEPLVTCDIGIGTIGPVVGVHAGPGTIGVAWTEPS